MAFGLDLQARYGRLVDIRPQDEHGMLDVQAIIQEAPDGTAVYCCGPEGLIAAVDKCVSERPGLALYVERFHARADLGERRAFEVELAESGMTLTVPPDRSILDVIEEAGVSVLSSCHEGTCGTCETTVLAGSVDHRDSILTDEERAANDCIMLCVSRAASDTLVLDL
jgi:ferredoxin